MILKELRDEIDVIDEQIVALLVKRFNIVKSVKEIKLANEIEIQDSSREKEVIEKIKGYSDVSYAQNNIINIYNTIFIESKNAQR